MNQLNLALVYVVFGCGMLPLSKTLEEKGVTIIITMSSWLMASYMLESGKTGVINPIVGSIVVILFTTALFLLLFLLKKMEAKYTNAGE